MGCEAKWGKSEEKSIYRQHLKGVVIITIKSIIHLISSSYKILNFIKISIYYEGSEESDE